MEGGGVEAGEVSGDTKSPGNKRPLWRSSGKKLLAWYKEGEQVETLEREADVVEAEYALQEAEARG